MKPKEYNIKTISDIADAVTVENLDNFIIDLKNGLDVYTKSIAIARLLDPELIEMSNTKIIAFEKMIWIDDNNHEQDFHIKTGHK